MSQDKVALQPDQKKIRIMENAAAFDQSLRGMANPIARKMKKFIRNFQPYYFTTPPLWKVLVRSKLTRDRLMPGFLSLGAVKSGTTSLADYILQHPCCVLPLAKEISVNAAPLYNLVKAQFPSKKSADLVEKRYGKAITGFCAPVVPGMAFPFFSAEVAADAKIIVIMRNPVERAFSHWKWDQEVLKQVEKDPLWKGWPRDFAEVVKWELEAAREQGASGFSFLSGSGVGGYIQHSIYLPFVKLLCEKHGRDKILFLKAEDFFKDPISSVKKIYQFLDLPDYTPVDMTVKAAGPKLTMSAETRQQLCDFFAPLNQRLYDFIGQDFGWK